MRILHVISELDAAAGGPPVALAGLAPAQVRAGLEVAVCATFARDGAKAAAEKLRAAGVEAQLVGPATRRLAGHPELAGVVRRMVERADVVHIHALWEEIQHQAAVAARSRGVPYVFRPCGMLDPWSLAQSKWKKRVYMAWRLRRDLNGAAATHYTSEIECELARPLKLRPEEIVEPNGVDLKEFEALPPKGTFRTRYDALAGRPMVLFLSRLHPKKGLELLIPAFAGAKTGEAVLVVAGPGDDEYVGRLKALAAREAVGERVLFTGMLRGAERVAALADADLFVLPSYQENFGVSVVEALAAGCPVLISDQVNIYREILSAGVGGVTKTDVTVLADDLSRWMTDSARRASAAEKARPFVWKHYDWEQIARRWAGRYEEVVSRK